MDPKDERGIHDPDAQREVVAERNRVAEIAGELRRRAQPEYIGVQARGAVIRKTKDMKNRVIRSPVLLGTCGALLGMGAARLIRSATAGSRKERIEWKPADRERLDEASAAAAFDNPAEPSAEGGHERNVAERVREGASTMAHGVKDTAATMAHDIKDVAGDVKDKTIETASHLKDRAGHVAENVRDRLPSGAQVKHGARKVYRFATNEQPVVGGVFALGVGMALGFLIPVAAGEKELLEPLKKQAAKNLGDLEGKVEELGQRLGDQIAGDEESEEEEPTAPPFEPSSPSIH